MKYLLLGILFIGVGLIMLIKPQIIYYLFENSSNRISSEPSDLYIFSTRFGGVEHLLLGLACVIYFFLYEI